MNGTRLTFFLIFASVLISCRKDEPAPATHDQELSEDALVFLRDYMQPLDPSSLEGFEFLEPSGLEDYQFIFSGESHGTQGNFAMDLAMLKYLNEIGWLDYYSPEMPFSFCWFVNHFLETGDEEMLNRLFGPFEGTLGWSKENLEHYRNLYDYNQDLPANERIRLIGIEIEHVPENPLWMMHELLGEGPFPEEIGASLFSIDSLYNAPSLNYNALYQVSFPIEGTFTEKKEFYQDYFEEDWDDFEHIIQLTNRTYEAKQLPRNDNSFFEAREDLIFENFLRFYQLLPPGRWYGQWGSRHIYQHPIEEMESIAQQLHTKDDSPLKGKILSLMYIYQGSTFLNNNPYRVQPMPPPVFEKYFESLSLGAFTLFPLSGPMSPFSQSLIWPVSTATPTDGVTTDYFQYLVLVDGSEAVQPIR